MNTITGLVLAGGQARRMGGGDKGLLMLAGKPLVAHSVARLQPQVSHLIINANRQQSRYYAFADTVVADIISGFAGPLAGIHAGMVTAQTPWLLSVPCDSPFFPDNLASTLLAAATHANADIAVAESDGRAQPVFMLARCRLANQLAATLRAGKRKIDAWYAQLPAVTVRFADSTAFDNINTHAELAQAEQRMQNS